MVKFREIMHAPPLSSGYPLNMYWEDEGKRLFFVNSTGSHIYCYQWVKEDGRDAELTAVCSFSAEQIAKLPDTIIGRIHFIIPNSKHENEYIVSMGTHLIAVKWDFVPIYIGPRYEKTYYVSRIPHTWYSQGFIGRAGELIVVQQTNTLPGAKRRQPALHYFSCLGESPRVISHLDTEPGMIVHVNFEQMYTSHFYYRYAQNIYMYRFDDVFQRKVDSESLKDLKMVTLQSETSCFDATQGGVLFMAGPENTVIVQNSNNQQVYCTIFLAKTKAIHSIALKNQRAANTFFIGGVDHNGKGRIFEVQFSK